METKSNSKSQSNEGLKVGAGAVVGTVIGAAGTIAAEPLYATTLEVPGVYDAAAEQAQMQGYASEADEPIVAQAVNQVDYLGGTANGEFYTLSDVDQNGSESAGVNVSEQQSNEDLFAFNSSQQDIVATPVHIEAKIEGDTFIFTDLNANGVADLVAVDLNQDGLISSDEVLDISSEAIGMSEVAQLQYESYTNDLAYSEEASLPDYVNDADVNEYMA